MTTPKDTSQDVDLEEFLRSHRLIAILWSVEDVQLVRPDLSDDQAWDVLRRAEEAHNCEYGLNWKLVEYIADDLYPQPDRGNEENGV